MVLQECRAHDSDEWLPPNPNDKTTPYTSSEAYPPDSISLFPSPASEAPNQKPTTEEEDSDRTTFSSSITDILRGSLRGHSISLPERKTTQIDPNTDNEGVKRICSYTDYPEICLSTISPFLGQNFDPMDVLEASLKACSYQLKLTLGKVKRHAAISPELASTLTDCRDQYANAMENLQRATAAIPSRDLGTVTVMLTAVMADVSTCESGFEDLKSTSPMANSEGLVTITASNSLSIVSLIPY
ncbi:hypothetical protein VNO77_23725 [Canavalia gladiata]|uniref:Pectinesterase inhibitor domain-containing protein n=1 Tax=Canavalia gladiata TaxID=3824 RepID=A0AAN9Q976_CANGL